MTNGDIVRTINEVGNPNRIPLQFHSNDVLVTLLNAHLFVKPNRLELFYESLGWAICHGKCEGEKRFAALGGSESLETCIEAMTAVSTMSYIKEWFDTNYFEQQIRKMEMNAAYDQDIPMARLYKLDDCLINMLSHSVFLTIG